MAYEKHTWECGEKITADKMNNLENGIEEALQGGGGGCGYECAETSVEAFNGSLTTASMGNFYGASFTPSYPIEGDSIVVTLNGTDYTLPKTTVSFGDVYGEADGSGNPVFTNYPCAVGIMPGQQYFFTPSEGTYQVVVIGDDLQAEVSECFTKAVEKVVGSSLKYVKDDPSNHGGVIENAIEGTTVDGMYLPSGNVASGKFSHAEGYRTSATGEDSHAEGFYSRAEGQASHAEGRDSYAEGLYSHAEGQESAAHGEVSHAQGYLCHARGNYSHASGVRTNANGYAQTVIGKNNEAQGNSTSASETDYAFIIGNGSDLQQSNAFAIRWDGAIVLANGTVLTVAQLAKIATLA